MLSGGLLTRVEMDWVRAGLGGMWRMDGPKLRPETSALIGMGDSGWNERCLYYWGSLVCSCWEDPTLGTSPVFVVCVSRKGSLIEDSECG